VVCSGSNCQQIQTRALNPFNLNKGLHMQCPHCGQDTSTKLSMEEYQRAAIPRLAAIDALAKKINFSTSWQWTLDGERYERLMREQMEAEAAAGL
jgi:hypothetical protein